jgi:hypothetical protein
MELWVVVVGEAALKFEEAGVEEFHSLLDTKLLRKL